MILLFLLFSLVSAVPGPGPILVVAPDPGLIPGRALAAVIGTGHVPGPSLPAETRREAVVDLVPVTTLSRDAPTRAAGLLAIGKTEERMSVHTREVDLAAGLGAGLGAHHLRTIVIVPPLPTRKGVLQLRR